jgi:ATP-dependent exoDNAse (exonuclease V) beta subunit
VRVRLFYVALTRSRDSVIVIPPPSLDYEPLFSTNEILKLAKRLGVEVIRK